MSILFLKPNENGSIPMRSWLDNVFDSAVDQQPMSNQERVRIYAASNITYRAANKRAAAVSGVPLEVLDSAGEPLPKEDPLVKALQRNFRDNIKRSELALCLWGHNLLVKRRSENNNFLYRLRWVNPNQFNRDIGIDGLKGFRVVGRRSGIPERYVKLRDAVFMHEMDFNDDFAGVSPAQVAINDILTGIEMSLTKKSFMENRAVPNWIAGPRISANDPRSQPKEEDANRLMSLLQSLYKGSRNAGRTLIDRFAWEFTNLTMDWDKIKFSDQYADVYEAVAIAFDMPISLVRETESNYAQTEVVRRDWGQSWLIPRCDWYAEIFTEQILQDIAIVRRYGTGLVCKPNFDDVQMLREDDEKKVNKINAQLQAGYRDLFTAAVETGVKEPPETLKGYYIWGGVPTHISTLTQVQPQISADTSTPAPAAQMPDSAQVLPSLPAQTSGIQMPPAQQAAEPPTGKSICIMIGMANDPELIDLQNKVKQRMANTPVKWSAPDSFHATLVYAPAVSDTQIAALKTALNDVEWVDDMTLPIGSLRSFDNLGEHAIHFSLRSNSDLLELQSGIVDLCLSLGITISTYSKPENYKPHITMGYAEQKPTPIIFQSKIKVAPQEFQLGVGDDVVLRRKWISEPEPEPPPVKAAFLPDDMFTELKVAAKKGAGFKPDKLPPATVTYITALKSMDYEQEAIVSAAKMFTTGILAAKAISATQRDFEREFDDLMAAARADETTRRQASAKLRYLINVYSDRAFLDGLRDGGMEDPVMTDEDKDALAQIKAEQSKFVTNFMSTLFKEGISDDQAVYKATQWFNGSINPAYLAGLESAAGDGLFEWTLGATEEHCGSCLDLNKQIHRFSEFKKAGFLPKAKKLICGRGNLCDCSLKPATGKPRGSLKSVRSAARSHEHDHEHEPVETALPEPA